MLSKILLSATLVATPALAGAPQEIRTGEWEDGTRIAYQCSYKAQGQIKFMLVHPDGTTRQGLLVCGETV